MRIPSAVTALMISAALLPTGRASAGVGRFFGRGPAPLVAPPPAVAAAPTAGYTKHAVMRPAFGDAVPTRKPPMTTGYEFPTRPLFIGGYAGYNYGRGLRQAYVPTGYNTGTIATVEQGFSAPVRTHGRHFWSR